MERTTRSKGGGKESEKRSERTGNEARSSWQDRRPGSKEAMTAVEGGLTAM